MSTPAVRKITTVKAADSQFEVFCGSSVMGFMYITVWFSSRGFYLALAYCFSCVFLYFEDTQFQNLICKINNFNIMLITLYNFSN